jgi:hypothetical protein
VIVVVDIKNGAVNLVDRHRPVLAQDRPLDKVRVCRREAVVHADILWEAREWLAEALLIVLVLAVFEHTAQHMDDYGRLVGGALDSLDIEVEL